MLPSDHQTPGEGPSEDAMQVVGSCLDQVSPQRDRGGDWMGLFPLAFYFLFCFLFNFLLFSVR